MLYVLCIIVCLNHVCAMLALSKRKGHCDTKGNVTPQRPSGWNVAAAVSLRAGASGDGQLRPPELARVERPELCLPQIPESNMRTYFGYAREKVLRAPGPEVTSVLTRQSPDSQHADLAPSRAREPRSLGLQTIKGRKQRPIVVMTIIITIS